MVQRRILGDARQTKRLAARASSSLTRGPDTIHALVMKHTGALTSYNRRILAPLEAKGGGGMFGGGSARDLEAEVTLPLASALAAPLF